VSEPRFDLEDVFDEDYLYFYEEILTEEGSDAAVELIWKLLELEGGRRFSISPAATAGSRTGSPSAARA
jgi:hypothetical protein